MKQKIEQYCIVVILGFLALSLFFPDLFIPIKTWISLGLGFLIFSIGLNTPLIYLKQVLSKPKSILTLVILRYIVMSGTAWVLARYFQFTQIETIGLIVLSASPGGTAANVMAHLSGSNVGMTLLLTFGTTLLSPFITPVLIYVLLHQEIQMNIVALLIHISKLIFIPIGLGLLLNYLKFPFLARIKNLLSPLAIIIIGLLVGCTCAINHSILVHFPIKVAGVIVILNIVGYCLGGLGAYLLRLEKTCILAVAFDYGMFDCVVAIMVCTTFFPPESAVLAILMGVSQSVTAPLLVRFLGKHRNFKASQPALQ